MSETALSAEEVIEVVSGALLVALDRLDDYIGADEAGVRGPDDPSEDREFIREARAALATLDAARSQPATEGLDALASRWEESADTLAVRALIGDPGGKLATIETLRHCAAALRAALAATEPAE